jgi:Fic/DOC family
MTLVTKKIKGHCYYYFQDSLSRRETPITTYIGKKTLSDWFLAEEVQDAIKRHFLTLPASKERQHFRYPPTDPDYTSKYLNHLRDNYILIKNNYGGEMELMSRELFVKYVHSSNAIENNTLSESEVSLYLYNDIPPKDKLQNELQQTRNHLNVTSYLDLYNRPIDASLVKNIHRLMMKNVDGHNDYDNKPGRYRSNMVVIGDSNRQVPKPEDVPKLIKKLVNNYYHDLDQNIHPIECMLYFTMVLNKFTHLEMVMVEQVEPFWTIC